MWLIDRDVNFLTRIDQISCSERMPRSSRSKPAEELVELPEENFESEEDADYSNDEPESEAAANDEDEEDDQDEDEQETAADGQDKTEINPYEVLGIPKTATASQIRKVYHKAALKHHPDKVPSDQREQADVKFKDLAFAYGILSDEKKRKLYDSTGRTDGEGSDFDWNEFMANQYKVVINSDVIDNVRKEYVNSQEERDDVLKAYKKGKGNWTVIFEEVMLSVMLNPEDETRFRKYIDEAIEKGEVKSFNAYNESKEDRAKRLKRAEKEAKEAEKILKKMGVNKDPSKMTEDELGVLIRSRKPDAFANLDANSTEALARHYEEKYGTPKKKKDKKRKQEESRSTAEPSEEEFLAAQQRIKKNRQMAKK